MLERNRRRREERRQSEREERGGRGERGGKRRGEPSMQPQRLHGLMQI